MKKAKGIVWDLGPLYPPDAKTLQERDLADAIENAKLFKENYRGKLNSELCDAEFLGRALQEYEDLQEKAYRPYVMANLQFFADGRSDEFKAAVAKAQDSLSRMNNDVLFFSLEIQEIPDEKINDLLASSRLDHFRHYVEALRQFAPFMLSEPEEQVINRKNLSGKTAFVNLFDEFTASFEWEFEVDGKTKTLTQSEMRELARNQDADLRYRSKKAHDGKFGDNALIFTNIFGSLIKDHATEIEMRNYDSPIQPSHLRNKVPAEVVDMMMDVVSSNNKLVQQYCRLKAKMIKLPKLKGSDLYAPVIKSDKVIPFDEGRRLVVESMARFSPEFGGLIQKVFDERWIDAEIRPGKRGGAFCYSMGPSAPPFVLMNYVDDLDSVYTMAHEFGHALHTLLACQKETLLTFHPPLILAETASVFAEMLLTRKLLAEETDRDSRIQIIASKLEDFFGTISRQTMYTRFELDAHLEGAKRRLSADDFCQLWLKRRDELYGDTVEFLAEEKWFWSVIPHFIHSRFYCYAYTFGALFVLALFNRYEEEGESFVPKYRALLAAGDSDWPATQIEKIGLDFSDKTFWEGGFKVVESLLHELTELVS